MEAQRFVTTLIAQFGGARALADQWHQAFTRATDAKRLRAATSLIFLIEKFQQNPESMNLKHLDDLEAEQQRLARLIIAEQLQVNPQGVAELAREHGFVLTPARATPSQARVPPPEGL